MSRIEAIREVPSLQPPAREVETRFGRAQGPPDLANYESRIANRCLQELVDLREDRGLGPGADDALLLVAALIDDERRDAKAVSSTRKSG